MKIDLGYITNILTLFIDAEGGQITFTDLNNADISHDGSGEINQSFLLHYQF